MKRMSPASGGQREGSCAKGQAGEFSGRLGVSLSRKRKDTSRRQNAPWLMGWRFRLGHTALEFLFHGAFQVFLSRDLVEK